MSHLPRGLALVRVTGTSMQPTLREGDVVLVRSPGRPRAGRIAVVRLPPDTDGAPRPLSIKRLTGPDPADPARWWIERDNPRAGVDSWLVGSLAAPDVLGMALLRVWPHPKRLPRRSEA